MQTAIAAPGFCLSRTSRYTTFATSVPSIHIYIRPTNWRDLVKRYMAQPRKCSNEILSAIILTDKHRFNGISVIEN